MEALLEANGMDGADALAESERNALAEFERLGAKGMSRVESEKRR